MPTIACPDRDTLQNLLLGKLPVSEREALSEHLLTCERCVALAETLSPSDSLTAALRKRRVFPAPDEKLAEVIEKAKQIQPPQETLPEGACFGEDTSATPVSAEGTVKVPPIGFLHPAEQPDEMGRLGGYRVLDVLGAGGMGIVFLAEDAKLQRLVALKAMKPSIAQDEAAKDRFLREAQATAAIEHDHIVSIYQVGEDQGVPFIAMRYLRGESLKCRLEREGLLDEREILRIGREIASGLAVAHAQGLIHRDIKPDNIWLEGDQGRVKILDFGLVRAVTSDVELTQSGVIMGTPKYMAPEQAEGLSVDARSDLFSLGSVLYHLAAGKPPFEAASVTATLMAVAHQAPAPVGSLRPELSPELARLIMELLAKKREARPQSAREVVERIRAIERKLDQEATVSFVSTQPANRFPGGRKKSLALATLAGCVILFGVILIIRDRDGNVKGQFALEEDDRIEVKEEKPKPEPPPILPVPATRVPANDVKNNVTPRPAPAIETTDPISGHALVTRPAKLRDPNVISWTIETRQSRGGFDYWRKAMALQPAGRLLAIVPADGTMRLLDRETGRTEKTFLNPHGVAKALAWSPDGKTLAVASSDETLAFWNPDQGRILAIHQFEKLSDIAWSTDGKRLAIAADQLVMWDPQKQDLVPSAGGKLVCEQVAWKPDGTSLAVRIKDQIALVDTNSTKITRIVFKNVQNFRSGTDFAWSPDGRYLASVSNARDHAEVWDSEQDAIRRIECPGDPTNDRFHSTLAWSPDGRLNLCFISSKIGGAHFTASWNLDTGKPGPWLQNGSSQSPTRCLEWSRDGRLLVMGTQHGRLVAYDSESPDNSRWEQIRPALAGHNSLLNTGTWSANGRKIAFPLQAMDKDWTLPRLCVWDLAMGIQQLGQQIDSWDIAWTKNGDRLLAAGQRPTSTFDAQTLNPLNELDPKASYAAAFVPNGKQFAIAVEGAVEIRETLSGAVVHRHPAEEIGLGCQVRVSSDGLWLAAGQAVQPSALYVWHTQTGELREIGEEKSHHGWPVGFSPEGQLLVQRGNGFSLIDVPRSKILRSVFVSNCKDAAWTRDYKAVRTVDGAGTIRLWVCDQDLPVAKVSLPTPKIGRAAFSPETNLLLTKTTPLYGQATFGLWNAETGHPVGTYVAIIGGNYAFISPEGHYSGSEDLEKELVYVVQTAEGQEMLSPAEFSKRFGWKNEPDLATPLLATPTSE